MAFPKKKAHNAVFNEQAVRCCIKKTICILFKELLFIKSAISVTCPVWIDDVTSPRESRHSNPVLLLFFFVWEHKDVIERPTSLTTSFILIMHPVKSTLLIWPNYSCAHLSSNVQPLVCGWQNANYQHELVVLWKIPTNLHVHENLFDTTVGGHVTVCEYMYNGPILIFVSALPFFSLTQKNCNKGFGVLTKRWHHRFAFIYKTNGDVASRLPSVYPLSTRWNRGI